MSDRAISATSPTSTNRTTSVPDTTGSSIISSSNTAVTDNATITSNPYQELLERVIRQENASVIRVVWYVIEQTRSGHGEVEASYSQLQTALNISRCGVNLGVSRALEAGYISRTNSSNTGGATGSGKSSMSGNGKNGGSEGGGSDHASARYVINLPVVPVTPTDAPIFVQATKSVKQTANHRADEDKVSGADVSNNVTPTVNTSNNNEGEQEEREEWSGTQTAFNQTASAVLSYDSNIESLLELEVESDVPATAAVGKPDRRRRATAQPDAEADEEAEVAADVDVDADADEGGEDGDGNEGEKDEGYEEDDKGYEGDDNEPDGGTTSASTPTPSQSQSSPEQPHPAQVQKQSAAGGAEVEAGAAEAEAEARARSDYLANLSRDFSRELGDLAHGRSNVTQIHNLWRESGLSEQEFGALLYQSRDLCTVQSPRHPQRF